MRPVERGNAPRAYADYKDAQADLIAALGDYCSYCERQIETNLAVEHIQPKSRRAALRNTWENFLLGCVNCNSCKGRKAVVPDDYLWPDTDNTIRAFQYAATGEVLAGRFLRAANRTRAANTIGLLGLDRIPGHPDRRRRPSKTDLRWRKRQEVLDLAGRMLARLAAADSPQLRDTVVDAAVGRGLFSIWMQVFENDPDMRRRLIAAFRGTSAGCFSGPGLTACRRTGGHL